MIVGIGQDICNVNRISNTINRFGYRFKNRIYTKNEIIKCEKRLKSVDSYARRFAAKEACSKALGTGLARGVFWKDIEIKNNENGKPFICLHNTALKLLKKMHCSNINIGVSLSDEKNYAIANVIIFTNEK